jgi:hypothetical protein
VYWFEGHAYQRGPPLSPQEELNIRTDSIATEAQTALPPNMKSRTDCLDLAEKLISIVIQHRKVTSHLPYHISNAIHGPKLLFKYLSDKEKWPPSVFRSITWDSFNITFNKLTTAWCTNLRHNRERGHVKECCFCGNEDEDWRHVLVCQDTGALIFRTGSWAQPQTKMNKCKIHQDIWKCFDRGLHRFTRHPLSDDLSRPSPPSVHHSAPIVSYSTMLMQHNLILDGLTS